MKEMGMTDKQFDAYVRAIMKNLIEAKKKLKKNNQLISFKKLLMTCKKL